MYIYKSTVFTTVDIYILEQLRCCLSYPKLYSLVYYESQNHGLKTGINILSYTSDVQFFLSLHMI